MKYKHTNRHGFLLGFIDFFTAGLFFLVYMQLGLQDELDEILGRRTQRYWKAYLLGIPTLFIYTLIWMAKISEGLKEKAIELGIEGNHTSFRHMEFMRDYYNSKYEDPVGEICEGDDEFYKIRYRTYRDIEAIEDRIQAFSQEGKKQSREELEGWLQNLSDELNKMLNKTLDNLGEKYTYIIEKAYLQGAYDRERMLR